MSDPTAGRPHGGTHDGDRLLLAVLSASRDGLATVDADGVLHHGNEQFAGIVGLTVPRLPGIRLATLFTDGGAAVEDALTCALRRRDCERRQLLLRGAASAPFPGEVEIVPVDDPPAGGVAALVVVRPAADEQYRIACERSPLGIAITDHAGVLVQVNDSLTRLLGYRDPALPGRPLGDLLDPRDAPKLTALLTGAGAGAGPVHVRPRRNDGHPRWLRLSTAPAGDDHGGDGGLSGHLVLQAEDVTAEYRAREQVTFLAHHDALTGLANRTALAELRRTGDTQAGAAVLVVDLDGFKAVNDGYGHAAGDQLLVVVADRLRQCVRERDVLVRQGGDEFVILLAEADAAGAAAVAGRIVAELSRPVPVTGGTVSVAASVGIALRDHPAQTVDRLLVEADRALYRVKKSGKNGYAFFSSTRR